MVHDDNFAPSSEKDEDCTRLMYLAVIWHNSIKWVMNRSFLLIYPWFNWYFCDVWLSYRQILQNTAQYFDGAVQDCSISSVLAMEMILQSLH